MNECTLQVYCSTATAAFCFGRMRRRGC